jgi:hypothetical protein
MRDQKKQFDESQRNLQSHLRAPLRNDTITSLFNINERVFNMVIKNHIEDIECFECL